MRKVAFAVVGALIGWVVTSCVGGILLGTAAYYLGLDPSIERGVIAIFVLAGIIAGGMAGARLADRQKSSPHTAEPDTSPEAPTQELRDSERAAPKPGTAPQPSSTNSASVVDEMMTLVDLHNRGVLSREEFDAARARLLSDPPRPEDEEPDIGNPWEDTCTWVGGEVAAERKDPAPPPLADSAATDPRVSTEPGRESSGSASGMPPAGASSSGLEALRAQHASLIERERISEVATFRVDLGDHGPGQVWLDAAKPDPILLPLAAVSAAANVAHGIARQDLEPTARKWLNEFAEAGSAAGFIDWLGDPDPTEPDSYTVSAIVYRHKENHDLVVFDYPDVGTATRTLAALWAASERAGHGRTVRRALELFALMHRADLTSSAIKYRIPARLVLAASEPSPYEDEAGIDALMVASFEAQGVLDGLIRDDAYRILRTATHPQVSSDWESAVTVVQARHQTQVALFYKEFGLGVIVSRGLTSAEGSRTVTNEAGEPDTAWGVDDDEMLISGEILDGWDYELLKDVFTHVMGHMPPLSGVASVTIEGGGNTGYGLVDAVMREAEDIPDDPDVRAAVLATLLHAADAVLATPGE